MDMNEPLSHLHPLVWNHEDARDERSLFIRELVVPAHIGVYAAEQGRTQQLRFDLVVTLQPPFDWHDRLDDVLNYDGLRQGILAIVGAGHINLLETLAERVVELCFGYAQVQALQLRISKLEAHSDCLVGYETRRHR